MVILHHSKKRSNHQSLTVFLYLCVQNHDHLGNTRLTYSTTCNGTLQTQTALDYYPYFVHKMMINHYINANYKNYPSYVPAPFGR